MLTMRIVLQSYAIDACIHIDTMPCWEHYKYLDLILHRRFRGADHRGFRIVPRNSHVLHHRVIVYCHPNQQTSACKCHKNGIVRCAQLALNTLLRICSCRKYAAIRSWLCLVRQPWLRPRRRAAASTHDPAAKLLSVF